MAPMIGIRFQFSPEMVARFDTKGVYDNLSDQELANLIKEKAAEYDRLSSSVLADVDGISSFNVLWYETQVAFNGSYQDKINANTTRGSGEAIAATAQGIWTGQSLREGIASAIIRREAALQGAVRCAGSRSIASLASSAIMLTAGGASRARAARPQVSALPSPGAKAVRSC